MSKRIAAKNPLLGRRAQVSNLCDVIEGLSNPMELTFGRVNHFCQYHGVTTLSNEGLASALRRAGVTVRRHLQGLANLGLVLAVYGWRKTTSVNPLDGYSRWLFTPSRHFARAFGKAICGSDKDPLSFFDLCKTTDQSKAWAAERAWRFLSIQENLFPGTASEAAAWLHRETGELPEEASFQGAYDASFFASFSALYLPAGVLENDQLRVLNKEPLPQSFPGEPERTPKQNLLSADAAPGATAQGAGSLVPGHVEMGTPHKESYFRREAFVMPERCRRLAKAHPDAFEVLRDIFPHQPIEQWATIWHRRFNKQLSNNQLKLSELELIRDYLSDKWKGKLTPEALSLPGTRAEFILLAAENYRRVAVQPLAEWATRNDEPVELTYDDYHFFSTTGAHLPKGWCAFMAGEAPDLSEVDNRRDWVRGMIFSLLTVVTHPDLEFAEDAPKVARNAAGHFLAGLCLFPDLCKLMEYLKDLHGFSDERFVEVFGFSIEDVRLWAYANTEHLRAEVARLQKFKWADNVIRSDETDPDMLPKLPSVSAITLAL